MLNQLADASIYSKIDLAHGYFQVGMDESSIKYTAFGTSSGLYEYLVMPMGLTSSGSTFSRLMTDVLNEYIRKICFVYLDDILIFSK